jgi:hypothetical protein
MKLQEYAQFRIFDCQIVNEMLWLKSESDEFDKQKVFVAPKLSEVLKLFKTSLFEYFNDILSNESTFACIFGFCPCCLQSSKVIQISALHMNAYFEERATIINLNCVSLEMKDDPQNFLVILSVFYDFMYLIEVTKIIGKQDPVFVSMRTERIKVNFCQNVRMKSLSVRWKVLESF